MSRNVISSTAAEVEKFPKPSSTRRNQKSSHRLAKFTKRKFMQVLNRKRLKEMNKIAERETCDCSIEANKFNKPPREECATKTVIENLTKEWSGNVRSASLILSFLICLLGPTLSRCEPEPEPVVGQQQLTAGVASLLNEYQLVGALGDQAHLPCLIGRQLYCGEPYFIAWYKLNSSSRSWTRIEHKSEDELTEAASSSLSNVIAPFNERVRFTWWRTQPSGSQQQRATSQARFACEQVSGSGNNVNSQSPLQQVHQSARSMKQQLDTNFDCATLTINSLELTDEGQYKCEITFSETLDFDKCPATTSSRLTVIGE